MLYSSMSVEDLVRACTHSGEPIAWVEFVRRFHRLIAGVVLRTARRWETPSRQVIDDLVQETYLKLCYDDCRLLRGFDPQHPHAIYGFLKVVTANVVHDHFKSARAEKRFAGHPEESIESCDFAAPQDDWGSHASLNRQILLSQIDRQLEQCFPGSDHERARLIFWLYYRQGLSASSIARLPSVGLTTKGVESTILRVTRQLRREMVECADDKLRVRAGKGFQPVESF